MSLAQRVAVATATQVVGRGLALVLSLVATKVITNYLGLEEYGSYATVLVGASLVFALADLGIPMLLARELSKFPNRTDELAGNLLTLRLLTCGVMLALTAIVVPFLPYSWDEKVGLLIATAGLLVGSVSLFPIPFFQVNMRLELAALAEVFARAVALAALGVVVLLDLGFLWLVASIAVAWGANLVLTFALSRSFWHFNLRWDRVAVFHLMRAALPIAVVAVLGLLHFRIDALLLTFLKPAEDVGIYVLAYSVFEQALFLPALFMGAVFPILTRAAHDRDEAALRDVLDKSLRFLVVLGVVIAVLVFTLADPLIRLLSNEEFSASADALRILSFAVVPLFATTIFSSLLVSLADLRYVAYASAFGIVANIALNLVLIPEYSYKGAAGVTVFSETLGFVLIYAIARRRAGATVPGPVAVRLAVLVVLAVAVTLATTPLSWWIAAPLATGVALGTALVVGAISRDEIRLVLRGDPALRGPAVE